MEETPLRSKLLLDRAQEGDDIVMTLALDGLHAIHVVASLAKLLHILGGDDAFKRPSLADEEFDFEPDAKLMLLRPGALHLRGIIAFYHWSGPFYLSLSLIPILVSPSSLSLCACLLRGMKKGKSLKTGGAWGVCSCPG